MPTKDTPDLPGTPVSTSAGPMVRSPEAAAARSPATPEAPAGVQAQADTLLRAIADAAARQQIQRAALITEGLDESKPGGRYMVEGVLVDAHGHPVKEEDKDDKDRAAEQAVKDRAKPPKPTP